MDSSVSIHMRNLQVLAKEVYESKHQILPSIMKGHFKICDSKYNLRRNTLFTNRPTRTQKFGFESPAYLTPRI